MHSQIYSALDAQNVRPFQMEATDVAEFAALKKIGFDFNERTMRKMQAQMGEAFGMDAIQQGLTLPNIPNLVQFLQTWLPGFVRIMTAARKIDELIGIQTIGEWSDEQIVQGVLETTGTAVPYGDLTNVPLASWNPQWATRTVIRFEEGMRVGILEEERTARIQINSAAMKREAAAQALDIQRNAIGFFGYNTGLNNTYGFLNDPNLPGYTTVPATGTGASTLWSNKTFNQIVNDILASIVQLRTQSQDTIDPSTVPLTLAVATNAVDRLATTSDFGVTVWKWLAENYPKIRVVSAPQLNTANGGAGVFYLYADKISDSSTDDGRTFIQVVPTKFRLLGMMKLVKGYEEDYSNATAGVLLKRPFAVVRYSGIS